MTLLNLAERCEQSMSADRNLDADIMVALGFSGLKAEYNPIRYTGSLDLAMTLVPEGCLLAITNCDADGRRPDFSKASAIVAKDPDSQAGPTVAATMPLALCAAALRAIAAATRQGGDVEQAPCEASQSVPKGSPDV